MRAHIAASEVTNQGQVAEPPAALFAPVQHQSQNFPYPVNPWRESTFENYRTTIRFVLWVLLRINVLMAALFSILFTYQFLSHLWSWCARVLFKGSW